MFSVNGKNLCEVCFADLGDSNRPCPFCNGKHNDAGYVTSLNNGVVLAGRYVVGRVLGKGGFGVTYLCYDTKSGKKVAVKEYFPDAIAHRNSGETIVSTQIGDTDGSFKLGAQKFYDEAKLVSRFNGNPNIIGVHEFFFENNTAYFVMEYLDGIDLKHYIASKGGKLPESEALYILDKISEALVIVHSMGVLHRDISPDNIFLTEEGNVKLIDFGAARQVMGEASKSLSVILKQGFAPLEQYQKKGNQGPWTDIYALGATIYYSVTGRVIDDAMSRIDNDALDGSGISPELFAVLQKMLSVRAENRYQSIVELKRDIAELVKSATTPELVKSHKTRFCPKCGKEVHGKQVLCDECSGTAAKMTSYGTSANPVNYGTSARTASYGTSVNMATQNMAPQAAEKKKISNKIPYIIAACISVVAILTATMIGILLSGKKSSDNDYYDDENNVSTNTDDNGEKEDPKPPVIVKNTNLAAFPGEHDTDPVFGNDLYKRSEITRIEFVKGTSGANDSAWDVSLEEDNSVLAWVEKTKEGFDLYIGSDRKINISKASKLFCCYKNVTAIDFNNRVSTENAEDMSKMFEGCFNLTELDLSCFDTSNCTNMNMMFSCCFDLKSLDVSSFNTEKVTDFSFMFSLTDSLKKLDLSGFSAKNAKRAAYMFYLCIELTSIDMSSFNPPESASLDNMFESCTNLTTVVTASETINSQLQTDLPGRFGSGE